jgi:hypothetical protein
MRTNGTYEFGEFHLHSYLKNIPYDHSLYDEQDIGNLDSVYKKVKGRYNKTERIYTFLHECNHYIQDLSIPACIAFDYFKDSEMYILKQLINSSNNLKCPLLDKNNIEYNRNILDGYNILPNELCSKYDEMIKLNDIRAKLFETKYDIQDIAEISITPDRAEPYNLSTRDLLESYAHFKSIIDLINRIYKHSEEEQYSEKEQYLNNYNKKMDLYQISFDGKQLNYIMDKVHYSYNISRYLYNRYVVFDLKEAIRYIETSWPIGYYENNLSIIDVGFILCLDIALTIPSHNFIIWSIAEGKHKIEDFSPVHRYVAILKKLKENQGFPDAIESESFYITLFNFFTNDANINWTNYYDTVTSWYYFFDDKLKQPNPDTSDGYRYRLIANKYLYYVKPFTNEKPKEPNPNPFLILSPAMICRNYSIPIFEKVNKGLKIITLFSMLDESYYNLDIPYEEHFSNYDLFHYPYNPFKLNVENDIKIEFENKASFMRETIYRIICRSIQNSINSANGFTCKFAESYNEEFYDYDSDEDIERNMCPSMDRTKCCNVKNLKELPTCQCVVREYLYMFKYNTNNINW